MIVTPLIIKFKKNGKGLQGYTMIDKDICERLGWEQQVVTCIILGKHEILDQELAQTAALEVKEFILLQEEVDRMKKEMEKMRNETD